MTIRRTRKQKSKARHQFTVSWDGKPSSNIATTSVKREKKAFSTKKQYKKNKKEIAMFSEHIGSLAIVKRDLIKSLLVSSLILGSITMIYFAWN